MNVKRKILFNSLSFLFITFAVTANGSWVNINEHITNAPHYKVIDVYSGQNFSIKWDNVESGAFLAGNAVVDFRSLTSWSDVVGSLGGFPYGNGLTITSTNWVEAQVKKSGVLIIYAPNSTEITLLPNIFLAERKTVSAWENNYPMIETGYRIKAFKTGSVGENPYPKYFNDFKLTTQIPLNYGPMDNCSKQKAFIVGINVNSDFITAGKQVTCSEYNFSTLNKYWFYNDELTSEAAYKVFSNDDESANFTHYGIKSTIAVFLLSEDSYLDCPEEVYGDAGFYYETDTADVIQGCHFWSYAKRLNPDKYNEIKNYKGYYAMFPIGIMKYVIQQYTKPYTDKDADYGVTFYNPVQGNEEVQESKNGFTEYIYADNLKPVSK